MDAGKQLYMEKMGHDPIKKVLVTCTDFLRYSFETPPPNPPLLLKSHPHICDPQTPRERRFLSQELSPGLVQRLAKEAWGKPAMDVLRRGWMCRGEGVDLRIAS